MNSVITPAHVIAMRSQLRVAGVTCEMGGEEFCAFVGEVEETEEGKEREFAAELAALPFPPSFGDPITTPEGEYHFQDVTIGYGLAYGFIT